MMRSRIFWQVYFGSVLLALPALAGGLAGRWGAGIAVALIAGLFVAARIVRPLASVTDQGSTGREAIESAFRKAHELEQQVEACSREQLNEERCRDLVENANDIIFTTDIEGRFHSLNLAGERAMGYTQDEARAMSIFDVVAPEYRKLVRQLTGQMLTNNSGITYEIDIVTRDGQRMTLEVSARLVTPHDSLPTGVQAIARDITERRLTDVRLRHNSLHDPLTGLPNRALFFSHLETAAERRARRPNYEFAILLLDVDRFKVVNDSLGHQSGDRLLVALSERLKNCVRSGDTVARFGGDEFTVLLDDISGLSAAVHTTERILAAFAMPLKLDGHDIFSSASIGIALSSAESKPEDLVRDADTAMYRAKFSGKARYQVFDPAMHLRATNLLRIETDLRLALDRSELEVYYQPIISLTNNCIVGFEALLRWNHPTRGRIAPSEFVPIAEETGLIIPIGRWVLREACDELRKWNDLGLDASHLVMSVNLSVKQFSQPDLANDVAQTLRAAGVPAHCLNLEITESAIVENAEAAHSLLAALKEVGVTLSTDDFGTGYSSLSYLHRFPIDRLKIDRSFVCDLIEHSQNAEIVRTIITLGASLGMEVVAEGIETVEQLEFLRKHGCPYGQGFLFSEPVPGRAAAMMLERKPTIVSVASV